jgi:acetyl-CoA acetyltransferase family protein
MGQKKVAIIGGVRTPFVKAGTVFSELSFQELSALVLKELMQRYSIDTMELGEVVWGTVLLDPKTPNWAREILFKAGLPKHVYAYSVSNNCISGLVAATCAMDRIRAGSTNSAIAGGAESMSCPSLLFNEKATKTFLKAFRAKTFGDKLKLFSGLRPKDFMPSPPSVTEPSTGLTMGQHMELTAKELHVDRASQDNVAFLSHQRADKAIKDGLLSPFILPVAGVSKDTLVRGDTTIEKLSSLKPVFDRSSAGTITAGSSSALTDGAACVFLMSDEEAKKEGREVLAYIKDYEYAAIDPSQGLLMAPAVAVPRLLKRHGYTFADFDLIEIHEAFGAQVVANIKAWEEGLKEEAVGAIDYDKVNTLGGSIALGHPFAATGGRLMMHLASELKRKNLKRGLISICAAGGMAGAMILERD